MPAPIDTTVRMPDAIRRSAERSASMVEEQRLQRTQAQQGDAPAPAPAPTPAAAPVTPERNFENDFKAMKGRYDRQAAEIRAMSEQLNLAQQQLALRTAPARSDVTFSPTITAQEETEYGSEFLAVVGKKAKDELSPQFAAMRAEIDGLKGQLGGVTTVVTQSAQERMYAYLDTQVPSWHEVNRSQNFLDWLLLTDPLSGSIRRGLLEAAFARNDASRVAAFFQGFIKDEAVYIPAMAPTLQAGATPQKVKLEDLAAPGRAKQAAVNTPPEKPIISRAEITKHYADSAAGRYRGRQEDYDAMERRIFSAQTEGRIR